MYSMPMFLTFFFLMIFPFPGNERTGTNTSLIQHDVMPIKPAPGAAGRNGQHPKPYSVLICPLFLVKHEFGMVAFCRGTAKLLSTTLIIFFTRSCLYGIWDLFSLISDALLTSCLPGPREQRKEIARRSKKKAPPWQVHLANLQT